MAIQTVAKPIRTAHLELVALTAPFVEAVVAGKRAAAAAETAASVGSWLTKDPSHVIQLHLAGQAAEAEGYPGFARAVVLADVERVRRVVGTIGFHGPPDERGRLEVSCRIHPAHRSRSYWAEALAGLVEWATARYGINRFLVALPSPRDRGPAVPIEIAVRQAESISADIDDIAELAD